MSVPCQNLLLRSRGDRLQVPVDSVPHALGRAGEEASLVEPVALPLGERPDRAVEVVVVCRSDGGRVSEQGALCIQSGTGNTPVKSAGKK